MLIYLCSLLIMTVALKDVESVSSLLRIAVEEEVVAVAVAVVVAVSSSLMMISLTH